jgi:hypothetical protein
MTALEDRLRAEFRAESDLVTPESIPALSLPEGGGGRLVPPRRGGSRRWPAWAAPAAAAAAVIAVIAGTFIMTHLVSGGHPPRREAGPFYAGLPSYYATTVEGDVVNNKYVESTVNGISILIHDTANGKVVTTISPPAPYNNFIVLAGSADGRTFVFGAERYYGNRGKSGYTGALDSKAPLRFVVVCVSAGSQVSGSAVNLPFQVLPGQEPSMALSPDGTKLAVAYGGGRVAYGGGRQTGIVRHTGFVRVVTLATGAVTTWQWPHISWTPLVSDKGAWSGDGRTLVMQQLTNGTAIPHTAPTWLLTSAGSGHPAQRLLLLRGPAGLSPPWMPFITPNGSELVGAVEHRTGGLLGKSVTGAFAVYSARTGALICTRARWSWVRTPRSPFINGPRPDVAWSNLSGSELLVVWPHHGLNRLGILTGTTVRLSGSPLPSLPAGYSALQNALQSASGIPTGMTW